MKEDYKTMGLNLKELFGTEKPVIGMVHLAPLPGSPLYGGNLDAVLEKAIVDARNLHQGGAHAVMVENFNDAPFYPETEEPETVAAMTLIAYEIHKAVPLPMGINVLRNSWKAALAIAGTVGADFIRLNILTDALVTDQGIINGVAHLALRYRRNMGYDKVRIFADVYSKHAAPIARRPLAVVAKDAVHRGMADAIIVSGEESADPPRKEDLMEVKRALPGTPVIIGSGMKPETVEYLRYADGSIFGYGAKVDDIMTNPVDPDKVRRFVDGIARLA